VDTEAQDSTLAIPPHVGDGFRDGYDAKFDAGTVVDFPSPLLGPLSNTLALPLSEVEDGPITSQSSPTELRIGEIHIVRLAMFAIFTAPLTLQWTWTLPAQSYWYRVYDISSFLLKIIGSIWVLRPHTTLFHGLIIAPISARGAPLVSAKDLMA
jgi:hypothetical protein